MNSFLHLATVVTLVAMEASSTTAQACPSDFDGEFGAGGAVLTDLGRDLYGHGGAIVVLDSGDILTAGLVHLGGNLWHPALLRYQSDGTLDPDFGTGGFAELDFEGVFTDLAVDGEGRLVAAGEAASDEPPYRSFLIARFHADGTLDPEFGDGGLTITPVGTHPAVARGLALLSDGRSVVVGQSIQSTDEIAWSPTVACYDASGHLDSGFGQGGLAIVATAQGSAIATGVIRVHDDAVVVSGYSGYPHDDAFVARIDKHGAPVAAFGESGVRFLPGAEKEEAWALTGDVEGRVYLASDFAFDSSPIRSKVRVHRLLADGSVDPTYGRGGKATIKFPRRFAARDIVVDADGVASVPVFRGSGRRSGVVRFLANGRRDRSFGTNGLRRFRFEEDTTLWGAVLQDDQKLLLGGSAGSRPLLLRLEGGTWDGQEQCVIGCGNGRVGIGEQCDDGNALNGDGCSAACLLE